MVCLVPFYQDRGSSPIFQFGAHDAFRLIDYINQVKTAIQDTKKVALLFKNENQRDYALLAMARIKKMQDEVDEVEAAQAEGVEI